MSRAPDRHPWRRRTRGASLAVWLLQLLLVAAFVSAWRVMSRATTWTFVLDAPHQLYDLLARMLPPDWAHLPALLAPLVETIHIATLGTLLALALGFPLALAAARRTTPHSLVRQLAIAVMVLSRSINALIWALILVTIVGPGPLAGVLAIALRSIGFVAKLLSEAIEEIDPRPAEAIAATGASPASIFTYSTLPQILPAFAGISIFRWEINLREATILGLVGAGGIGLALQTAIDQLIWPRASVILLLVLLLVVLGEALSARLRRALL